MAFTPSIVSFPIISFEISSISSSVRLIFPKWLSRSLSTAWRSASSIAPFIAFPATSAADTTPVIPSVTPPSPPPSSASSLTVFANFNPLFATFIAIIPSAIPFNAPPTVSWFSTIHVNALNPASHAFCIPSSVPSIKSAKSLW